MSIVYGPVPSWRLGRSLGIDPILPPKTCTFDCIYCQLGRTINKVSSPLETYRVDENSLRKELLQKLNEVDIKSINVVTFSGSGEPTLNPHLGNMIKCVKDLIPEIPVAVLTNSSLLHIDAVRKSLSNADIVVAKLDAGDQETFVLINRPASGIPNIREIIKNLRIFKESFSGVLAIQIMLVEISEGEKTNVDPDALNAIIEAVRIIDPDEVQVNTPTRPPSEHYVLPVKESIIAQVKEKFESMGIKNVLAIGIKERTPIFRKVLMKEVEMAEREILELLKRRPCRVIDIHLNHNHR